MSTTAPACAKCDRTATHRWEGKPVCLPCKRAIMRAWFHENAGRVVADTLIDCGIRNATVIVGDDPTKEAPK